jgi:hypothetical protein
MSLEAQARAPHGLRTAPVSAPRPCLRARHACPNVPPPAGVKSLYLTRLVLSGFSLAPPGGPQPPLWPEELLPKGDVVNFTDVRLVISDRGAFERIRAFFVADPQTETYFTVRPLCRGTWLVWVRATPIG